MLDLLFGVLSGDAYNLLKKCFKKVFGPEYENDKIINKAFEAVDKAYERFFAKFGKAFGPEGSSFAAREENLETLLRTVYLSSEYPRIDDLNPEGFDGAPKATPEALEFLLAVFREELVKDRELDAILQFKKLHRNVDKLTAASGKKQAGEPGRRETPKYLTPLPPRPVELIGRDKAFSDVAKLLENSQQVLLVNGLGGVGKTELCKSYFWQRKDNYKHLAWVDFVGNIKESFVNSFEMAASGEETIDQRFARILELLKGPARECLLVVDNIEAGAEEGAVEDLDLILSLPCRVLVSSRVKLEGFKRYDLDFLRPAECRELFLRFYEDGEDVVEEGEAKPPRPDDPELAEIIRLAGYHTLTVELLARTARNAARGIPDFLTALREVGFNLNETIPEQVETSWNRETGSKKFFDHLVKVFRMSGLSGGEEYILTNLTILPPVYIEMEDISRWLKLESKDGLNDLVKKGWLRRSGGRVFLHQVMGEAVFYQTGPDCEKCKNLIVAMANNLFCEPGENRLHKKEFLSYAEAILAHVREDNRDLATLANNLSVIYRALGLFPKALRFQLRALTIREKVLKKDHPDIAQSYNNLAMIYQDLGRLEEALEFQLKALEIREKVLDKDHPSLATSYNNVCTIYYSMEKLKKALEFQLKATEIYEKVLEKDHPDLATSYNNVSMIYKDLGRLEKALEFQLKAVEIYKNALKKDHPLIATSYNNLSLIYQALEQLEKAETYARRAVAILEKIFPDGHPNLDIMRGNLEIIRAKKAGTPG